MDWTGELTLKTIFTVFNKTCRVTFRPGNHIVEGNVTIGNVNTLKLIASDRTKTRLVCTLQAGSALILHNVFNAQNLFHWILSCNPTGK